MERTSVNFETWDFLVVREGEDVRFRCPVDLTDLRDHEPIDRFIAKHGGVDGTVMYLRRLLTEESRRSMGLRTVPPSSLR